MLGICFYRVHSARPYYFLADHPKIREVCRVKLRLLTRAEQVAAHLRSELMAGTWKGEMPGESYLKQELGVNHTTIGEALNLLENEKLLVPQGVGRRRKIVMPENYTPPALRVGLLLFEQSDNSLQEIVELRHRLAEAGHSVFIAPKSLIEVGMNIRKISRMVKNTEADAWIVLAGSAEVLDWFTEQPIPAIAYAGQYPAKMRLASIAPRRQKAFIAVVRRLVSLGHHRIVLLTGSGAKPEAFFEELEAQGIQTGSYNMPDWQYSPAGLWNCLDSLFKLTPPTALLIDEAHLFLAVQHHLVQNGVFAPAQVSLVCTDPNPAFRWYEPSIAHINWNPDAVVHRITRWVENVSLGKEDRQQVYIPSNFVDGGTVGPVPSKKR